MLSLSLHHLHCVLLSWELRATQPAAKGCTTWFRECGLCSVWSVSNLQLFEEYLSFIPFLCNSTTCHEAVDSDQHPLVPEQNFPHQRTLQKKVLEPGPYRAFFEGCHFWENPKPMT